MHLRCSDDSVTLHSKAVFCRSELNVVFNTNVFHNLGSLDLVLRLCPNAQIRLLWIGWYYQWLSSTLLWLHLFPWVSTLSLPALRDFQMLQFQSRDGVTPRWCWRPHLHTVLPTRGMLAFYHPWWLAHWLHPASVRATHILSTAFLDTLILQCATAWSGASYLSVHYFPLWGLLAVFSEQTLTQNNVSNSCFQGIRDWLNKCLHTRGWVEWGRCGQSSQALRRGGSWEEKKRYWRRKKDATVK